MKELLVKQLERLDRVNDRLLSKAENNELTELEVETLEVVNNAIDDISYTLMTKKAEE
ncbi:hypothetical protein MWH25_08105 [Natroniella acetigena]|uniref:hypothetical protein n=1 Tax=Natroniella acetigena TaxID=52004 RepID=UPI00200B3EA1|nr:hypothetical protein [Natroniella acetigena]MCK8827705.1 hypothetical protein [Natroniella acetigena]